ncbi:MAG TPA: succinate dehydrogenase, hydrophobic membrane anchor protein [Steroidobacteraceae bacterium]|nr:succinate dehydrogenase, hydrophobic membrane anchor protein [Steroidobacteraceae bacterium]
MTLRSPLRGVLGLGSAKEGVHAWWMQRLSALALVPLSIWFVVSLLALPALDQATLVAWMGQSWTALLLILFVLVAAWHSHLGVRVVLEDYVPDPGALTLSLVLARFVHVLLAAAGVFAVLRIAFGGAPP